MLTIELRNAKGDMEKFTQGFVSTRKFRSVMEFAAKAEDKENEMNELEQLDEMIAVVADLFDTDKVTYDTILDGVEASKIADVLHNIMGSVMNQEEKKVQKQKDAEELKKVTK